MFLQKTLKLIDPNGLHLRAAAQVVRITMKYHSRIIVSCGPMMADGRSILGLMTLSVAFGMLVTLTADGSDAREALSELQRLFESGFHKS